MKYSKFTELETSKRAMTLGRFAIIAGVHVVIIGGGYIVTKYGRGSETQTARAGANGLMTWSSQQADASRATVDDTSARPFDTRASNLDGYNAGEARASASSSGSSGGRFAPRRPEGDSRPSSGAPSSAPRNDEVLRPEPVTGASSQARSAAASPDPLGETMEYKVQSGDSLWGISQRFGVAVAEIAAANPSVKANALQVGETLRVPRKGGAQASAPAPARAENPAPSVAPADGSSYTVKSGDSLSRIASRQGVTVSALKQANGLASDMIKVGQKLVIPGASKTPDLAKRQFKGQQVVVEPGDTLDKIAALHGVTVAQLKELNDIPDPRLMRIGQTLMIPEGASAPAPTRQEPAAPAAREPEPRLEGAPRLQSTEELPVDAVTPLPDDLEALPALPEDFDDRPIIPIEE